MKKIMTGFGLVVLGVLVSACVHNRPIGASMPEGEIGFSPVTDEDIKNDHKTVEDVVTYGHGQSGQRFSPLKQINKSNVKALVPVWNFSFGGEKQRGQESQPLVKDGVMYVTGSYSRIWAINIYTGEEIWQYDERLPSGILPCCDVINRGAALYEDLVIFGTLNAKLVALDRKTGKVRWKKTVNNYKDGYAITAAPLIVNGLIVIGNSGGEFGIVGMVRAYDAKSGDLVWERPTIEGHMGKLNGEDNGITGTTNATWPGDLWKYGGSAPWLGAQYDASTDSILLGTGQPAPWNSHKRPGDNLYSSSRLAINPATGKIKWHFQTTPHDGWDFDGVNELIPFDYKDANGKMVQAAATADRNGFFYVLDRTDGKFISAYPFVSDITWAKGINSDGTPDYVDANRPPNPNGEEKGESIFSVPSFLGGKNWMPMGYSQKSKLFYVPSNEWGMDIWNKPISYKKGAAYLGAGFTIKPIFDDHIGSLKAIDPTTGKVKWEHKVKTPVWGGVLSTEGGLVFYGTPEGKFLALDDESGEVLYSFQVGSGIVSSPITWKQDGEQFVAIVSGWGGAVPLWGGEVAKYVKYLNQGGSVHVFKLAR